MLRIVVGNGRQRREKQGESLGKSVTKCYAHMRVKATIIQSPQKRRNGSCVHRTPISPGVIVGAQKHSDSMTQYTQDFERLGPWTRVILSSSQTSRRPTLTQASVSAVSSLGHLLPHNSPLRKYLLHFLWRCNFCIILSFLHSFLAFPQLFTFVCQPAPGEIRVSRRGQFMRKNSDIYLR